jgi:hypothetical protein
MRPCNGFVKRATQDIVASFSGTRKMCQKSAKTARMGSPAAQSRNGALVKQLNIIAVAPVPAGWPGRFHDRARASSSYR